MIIIVIIIIITIIITKLNNKDKKCQHKHPWVRCLLLISPLTLRADYFSSLISCEKNPYRSWTLAIRLIKGYTIYGEMGMGETQKPVLKRF